VKIDFVQGGDRAISGVNIAKQSHIAN